MNDIHCFDILRNISLQEYLLQGANIFMKGSMVLGLRTIGNDGYTENREEELQPYQNQKVLTTKGNCTLNTEPSGISPNFVSIWGKLASI